MPNHVRNIIRFEAEPEKIKEILLAIQEDESGLGSIDFNKLLPMPKELDIECGSRGDKALKLYRDFTIESASLALHKLLGTEPESINEDRVARMVKRYEALTKDDPELMELGERYYNNIQSFGHATWYDWCVEHWGTKWNAYDFAYDGAGELSFNTAWSASHPILQQLSEKFPDVPVTHLWADEDIGSNVGERKYLGGQEIESHIPQNCSVEAYEMAAEIRCEDLEADCHLYLNANGTDYEYREPEDGEDMEV